MANSLMGELQRAVRAITGTTGTYEGDWHAYFDMQGIPAGQFNGRMLAYGKMLRSYLSTFDAVHNYLLHGGPSVAISAYGYNIVSNGDYFSTPSATANQITGDITIVVEAALDDWTPSAVNVLVAKDSVTTGGRSYALNIQPGGAPRFNYSLNGSTIISITADAIPDFEDGIRHHIAVERTASTGKVRFYTSHDHITWQQLGTEQTGTSGNIFAGNAVVQFGNLSSLAYDLKGKIYDSEAYAGLYISGTGAVMRYDFDPEDWVSGSTFTSGETGEVWALNGNVLIYKAT